jgi:hypothetical protein
MNEKHLSLHLKKLNDKVKIMNQTGGKDMTLSAQEARSLLADVFDLMNHCTTLSKQLNEAKNQEQVIQVAVDGGGFK